MTVQHQPNCPTAAVTTEQVQQIVTDAIAAEREALEVRLVEQEHRGTRIVLNWYDALKGERKDLKRSAWLAMLWHFLVPKPTTVAIAAGGLVTLLITAFGVAMAYRANVLLERQNARIDVQNLLSEAQRRATYLSSELASLVPLIQAERDKAKLQDGQIFTLSVGLQGRVSSVAASLRPYKVIEIRDGTPTTAAPASTNSLVQSLVAMIGFDSGDKDYYSMYEQLLSPERSQLLILLLSMNVNLKEIENLDLSYAIIRKAVISGNDMTEVNLNNSFFESFRFEAVKLSITRMSRTQFNRTVFKNIEFDNVAIFDSKFSIAKFEIVKFNMITLEDMKKSVQITNLYVNSKA